MKLWPKTRATPSPERLIERRSDWIDRQTQVDETSKRVERVALAGRASRNGYHYTEQALRDAVALYEGRPVFLDHAPNVRRPFERSTRDLVGTIQNVMYEEGKIRGDIQVLDTDSGRTFLALAAGGTANVGMSHVVIAKRNPEKSLVESIEEVISVDAVVFPATTSRLSEQQSDELASSLPDSYEQVLSELDERLANLEPARLRVGVWDRFLAAMNNEDGMESYEIREWHRDPSSELQFSEPLLEVSADELQSGSWRDRVETDDDTAGAATREQLRTKLERLMNKYIELNRRKQDESHIDYLIREARLPESLITDEFKSLLTSLKHDDLRRRAIQERHKLSSRFAKATPSSWPRSSGEPAQIDQRFISAIRRTT